MTSERKAFEESIAKLDLSVALSPEESWGYKMGWQACEAQHKQKVAAFKQKLIDCGDFDEEELLNLEDLTDKHLGE